MDPKVTTVSSYILNFPIEIRSKLDQIRELIFTLAPQAVESISYSMPAYKLNEKPLIYFACFSKHIGIYATPTAHKAFKEKLVPYKQGKGSVQFPLDKPLPMDLIAELVKYKVIENKQK